MNIFLHLLFETFVLFNVTQIITESSLFNPIRESITNQFAYKLINCFLCTSVWVGFILSFILFNLGTYLGFSPWYSWFLNSLFFSSLTWFLHKIEGRL